MQPRLPLAVGLLLLLGPLPFQAAAPGTGHVEPWTGADGRTGWLGVPAAAPRALIVMNHGYGHVASEWEVHLQAAADRGYLAVAMDYSPGFDEVSNGAARTHGAAQHFAAAYDLDDVVLFTVSMGGAVGGLALAEAAPRPDGSDLFDLWVNVEGVTMQLETWAEAKAVGHPAAAEIEAENGGTPLQNPLAYQRRSTALRPLDIAARVEGVVTIHAVNDGLVPHDQGRELTTALRAAGVPADMYTALRGDPGELGTTGTDALGLPNPLGLTGHASELSTTHIVMRTALARLWDLLEEGPPPADREFLVDEELGQVPA